MESVRQAGEGEAGFYVVGTGGRLGLLCSSPADEPVIPVAHLRTARRVWRTVVLATHTPLTRVRPAPQAAATSVIMLSG